MRFLKNPNLTVAVLAVYTAAVYIYFFPRNDEKSVSSLIPTGSSLQSSQVSSPAAGSFCTPRMEAQEHMPSKRLKWCFKPFYPAVSPFRDATCYGGATAPTTAKASGPTHPLLTISH